VSRELKLLKSLFSRYYRYAEFTTDFPRDLPRREIALQLLENEAMVRHLSFNSIEDLRKYVVKNVPSHLYYSTAYYENPGVDDMDQKGWLGAELVFDIDVDHIPTPCKEEHDRWICENCGEAGRGSKPEKCPKCGGSKFRQISWICDKCLEVAREEALKVIEVLDSDFGVSPHEVYICFSGHRGFHIHVDTDVIRELSQDARREIADYMRLIGLRIDKFFTKRGKRTYSRLMITSSGIPGRLARSLYEKVIEVGTQVAREVELVLEGKKETISRKGIKLIEKLLPEVLPSIRCEIDEKVLIDTHRLIRFPNSLHGKTGLKVTPLTVSELERFSIEKAIVFRKGSLRVRLHDAPPKLFDMNLGNCVGRVLDLPMYVAIYLICRKVATLEE